VIRSLVCSAIAAVLLATCATSPPVSPAISLDQATGDWQLDHGTVDGIAIPIVDGFDITMGLHAPSLVGTAACNDWGGRLSLVDGGIRVTDIASTAKRCADDVMASEAAFMRAIGLVLAAQGEGDQLSLLGPGVELVFSRLAPPDTAALVGTTWRLTAFGEGGVRAPRGDPVTLRFDAGGSFSGSTGCRMFTGTWMQGTGDIVVLTMSMIGGCPSDLEDQDGFVVAVLGDGFQSQLDGDRLTLITGRSTLLYMAE
jgi:heat shock protein HslJ